MLGRPMNHKTGSGGNYTITGPAGQKINVLSKNKSLFIVKPVVGKHLTVSPLSMR